jgi:hypothetical protein
MQDAFPEAWCDLEHVGAGSVPFRLLAVRRLIVSFNYRMELLAPRMTV